MTETQAMADNNERPMNTNHQPKKKKVEEPLPPDIGLKPVQLQRRRVWRACESCRRKKIKCDGNEPTCSQCASSKSQCTWLQTKDRAALSRHYVQELEARLLHMETLFQQVAPILEQVGQASGLDLSSITASAASVASNVPPATPIQSAPSSSSNRDVAADLRADSASPNPIKTEDDMSESFGQLALDEHGQMRWIGSSSTMSLIQSFRTLTASPLHRVSPMEDDPLAPGPSANKLYFPASVFFGKVRVLPGPEEVEYPPRDLADKLVDAYFSRFHFLMPIIDKPSFLKRYQFVMDHNDDANLARRETPFLALLNSVFSCAAKMVDDPRLSAGEVLDDAGMGMVYYERALILQYISHTSMQVEHVQCFLLMSTFLCSVNCLPQAWILVGQAVRIAQDIGLHRSPRRLVVSSIEKETRRKVWWGCYILDRMLALALGRPLGIADSDCDAEVPVDVDDENLPEYFAGATMQNTPSLMKGFLELIALYKIAGLVLREVYSLDKCKEYLEPQKRSELNASVDSLDKALTKWCDELPIFLKSSPVTDKQVSMAAVLCTHYYSILTTLHRNFLPVKPDQPVSPRSTAKAVSTARACIRLAPSIKNVVPPSHHVAFFIQNLFSSAVVILLYAMHTTDPGASQAALEEAKGCLGVLESWEGYWPGARKCRELLEDLTATASEAIKAVLDGQMRMPTTPSNPSSSGPSAIPSGSASPTTSDPRVVPGVAMPTGAVRSRPTGARRNRSRDVHISPRLMPSAGYHRHDPLSQRARSTSRKRPHAEDFQEFASPSLAGVLSGSYPGRSNLSAHSSPVSVNSHPSPPSRLETTLEASPTILPSSLPNNSYMNMQPPQSPTAPVSNRFSYDFSVSQSPPETRWAGPTDNNLGMQQAGPSNYNANYMVAQQQQQNPIDNSYMAFDNAELAMGLQPMPTNAPSTGFSGPGLPFRGLDYIRNYNPGGYMVGDQEALWQTFDPGAFGLDPEIPFTLGDLPNDLSVEQQDGQQQQQQQHWDGQS